MAEGEKPTPEGAEDWHPDSETTTPQLEEIPIVIADASRRVDADPSVAAGVQALKASGEEEDVKHAETLYSKSAFRDAKEEEGSTKADSFTGVTAEEVKERTWYDEDYWDKKIPEIVDRLKKETSSRVPYPDVFRPHDYEQNDSARGTTEYIKDYVIGVLRQVELPSTGLELDNTQLAEIESVLTESVINHVDWDKLVRDLNNATDAVNPIREFHPGMHFKKGNYKERTIPAEQISKILSRSEVEKQ